MPEDSYLSRRRAELMAEEPTVPLDYDALREAASERLARGPYDYAAGGAGTEDTVRANRRAFDRYRILTRILRDVSERDLTVERLGREFAAPVMVAPIGRQGRYHDEGELATARAAAELGLPMAVSTAASHSIEAIAEANDDAPRYFQLYWSADWDVARSLVERAEAAGYDGIVLTVDSQLEKWRRRDLRNAYRAGRESPRAVFESDPVVRERAEAAGMDLADFIFERRDLRKDPTLTWEDLDALREWTDLPVALKGILSVADARRAAEWGAEGIVVSNHGGRQIDGAATSLGQLPPIAEAVGGETTIVVDGGVRTGADVFKALALGADAVQVGRPYVFGLAVAGQRGVRDVLMNLLAELESIMGLSGRPTVGQIDGDAVVHRPA